METRARLENFQSDAEVAIFLSEISEWPFTNFQVEKRSISFECSEHNVHQHFVINATEDYPDNSTIYEQYGSDYLRVIPLRVPQLLEYLVKELRQQTDKSMESNINSQLNTHLDEMVSDDSDKSVYLDCSESLSEVDDDSNDDDDDDNEFMQDGLFCLIERAWCFIHLQSHPALAQGDGYQYEDMGFQNLALVKDMEQLRILYGEDSVSFREFRSIDTIDIELNVPLLFLKETVAEAWKTNRMEPLVIRLHLSMTTYLDNPESPRVEIFQWSKKDQLWGLGCQLRKIIENFVTCQWKNISNRDILQPKASLKSHSVPVKLSESCEKKSSLTREESDSLSEDSIIQLMDMGFSFELARNAMIMTCGDLQEALDLLLNQPDNCKDFVDPCEEKSVRKEMTNDSFNEPFLPNMCRVGKKGIGRFLKLVSSATTPNLSGQLSEDLNLVPSSTHDGQNSKKTPSLEYGFLAQVFQYARQRIPTLNEYCVVCDEPHVFQNGAMLQPAVCSRELCSFAYQDLGVMGAATSDMATGAEVVDLLIAMTKAASKSKRREIILNPFPIVVDPERPTEFVFHPKHKDYKKMESVMDCFPSMTDMLWSSGKNLKKVMDDKGKLAYPLLQWIITSNRSHIVKLPAVNQLKFMRTNHQFLLLSSAPAKEDVFRAAKDKYGSTFAFHGSSIENWHSIIRVGLLNASGTKYEMNGSVYGKGIYLSPISSISSSYSRMGHGWFTNIKKVQQSQQTKTRFLQSDNINCIALCEVIKSPELKKHGNVWVCTKCEYVCTRFFFVYEDGQVGDAEINTQNSAFERQILQAVNYRLNVTDEKQNI